MDRTQAAINLLGIGMILVAGLLVWLNNRVTRLEEIIEKYYEVDIKDTTNAKN